MTKPKQLPCTVCGEPVTIPAKYARANSATCEACAGKSPKRSFRLGRGQRNLLLGIGFYVALFFAMKGVHYYRCVSSWQDMSIRDVEICVARFGPLK